MMKLFPSVITSPAAESGLGAASGYRRQRPRKSVRHRKPSEVLDRLNGRQRLYVHGVLAGKTKFTAALEAGYSRSSAENAAQIIEGPDVRAAFQAVVRREVSIEDLAFRLREGLDATEVKLISYRGKVTDRLEVIAWETRLKYIELAVKYGDYYRDKEEPTRPSDESDVAVLKELFARAEAALAEEAAATGPKDGPGDTIRVMRVTATH